MLSLKIVIFSVQFIALLRGECCPAVNKAATMARCPVKTGRGMHICEDCTLTPSCCAHGPCNIFCCNCASGCRQRKNDEDDVEREASNSTTKLVSSTEKYEEYAANATVIVDSILIGADMDGDGRLNFYEFSTFVMNGIAPGDPYEEEYEFGILDRNGNGFIDRYEIDASA